VGFWGWGDRGASDLLIIPDVKFFISLKQCGETVFSDQTSPMLIRGNRIIWQLIPGI
jgi:hypothetical protein